MILNVAVNPLRLISLEHPVLDFLGRISYGLYAYNWLAIPFTINLMKKFGFIHSLFWRNVYIYAMSWAVLVAMSAASYYLMERKFLKLKAKFGSISRSRGIFEGAEAAA